MGNGDEGDDMLQASGYRGKQRASLSEMNLHPDRMQIVGGAEYTFFIRRGDR
jgi:hypothetical protein